MIDNIPADVVVAGSGIAGLVAAIEAASAGARVAIVCSGPCFSGSSFYPGTWGLGLIAPEGRADERDLAETILRVGCGVADPALVHSFVQGIIPAIAWLEEELGCTLKRPERADEDAFIPCFDHKHRAWYGLERACMERAFSQAIERLGIRVFEHCDLIDYLEDEAGAPAGAIVYERRRGRLTTLPCRAIVLAGGGTGGLFARSLTSRDVRSSLHGVALSHGARLVNIEFMQMMPGLVAPRAGIVFNEKSFRFARFPRDVADAVAPYLAERSAYGPFTARLASRAVDLAIDAAGASGIALRYDFPEHDVPEFVQTFSRWLEHEQGIAPDAELRVAFYAHAANGGVAIDGHGSTGVPGLFAAGEGTGGMHGADRIGGLSSANGLVFGRRAGSAAAAWAAQASGEKPRCTRGDITAQLHATAATLINLVADGATMAGIPAPGHEAARRDLQALRATMSDACMVIRTETGLQGARRRLGQLAHCLMATGDAAATDTRRAAGMLLLSELALAHLMVEAMRARPESRGSHYRADHPAEDPALAHAVSRGIPGVACTAQKR